jgi:hypothetical protein
MVIAFAGVGSLVFTIGLAISTHRLWRETRRLAEGEADQSAKMAASIEEAARSASAMERVAQSMATNTEQIIATVAINREIANRQKLLGEAQLRAFLAVNVGDATYQDQAANLLFEARPTLVNSGATAAKNVSWEIAAKVLPIPLPQNYTFPAGPRSSIGMIPPNQHRIMTATVDGYVNDADVDGIKIGAGRILYVWGRVDYEDIFGNPHWLTFGQFLRWLPDGRIFGSFLSDRNECDS